MPKDKNAFPSSSHQSSRVYPYSNRSESNTVLPREKESEWEEIRCPICFELPHNPVLLICTSHEKGCRTYMCHTNHVMFDCFEQFRKSSLSPRGLCCPLCRGLIKEGVLGSEACSYLNSRPRSCSQENCDFIGTHEELMRHAMIYHASEGPRSEDTHQNGGSNARVFRRRPRLTGRDYKRAVLAMIYG